MTRVSGTQIVCACVYETTTGMVMYVLRHSQGVSHQLTVRDSSQTTIGGHHCTFTDRQIAIYHILPPTPSYPTHLSYPLQFILGHLLIHPPTHPPAHLPTHPTHPPPPTYPPHPSTSTYLPTPLIHQPTYSSNSIHSSTHPHLSTNSSIKRVTYQPQFSGNL